MDKINSRLYFCEECGEKSFIDHPAANTATGRTFRCPACNYLNRLPGPAASGKRPKSLPENGL